MKWIEPIVSVLGVTSLTASAQTTTPSLLTPIATSPIGTTKVKPSAPNGVPGVPETKLGINLVGVAYFSGTRAFSNLMAGGTWTLIQKNGAWVGMPADRLDANRNVVTLQSGEQAARTFSPPTAAYRGASTDIICRWQGKASVRMSGGMVKNVRFLSDNSLTFTFVPQGTATGSFLFNNINPSDPIRNIDCRERDADPNAMFDPTFLADVRRYSTIRFLKWIRSVESNVQVSWATRTKPGDGIINGSDSVPIEYMVELANQTGTNPWINIPWNADEEYIRNTAIYVRDHLNKNLKVYVETSNEVWNYQYAATHQAIDEATKAGLPGDEYMKLLRRYAVKTGEVMDIWASVYAGQSSRLVRVAATQNSDWGANVMLGYGDVAKKVDALATAPYFTANLQAGKLADRTALDTFFTKMATNVDERIAGAKLVKGVATKYGLRYITYEAGQHFLSPDDVAQLTKIQRDPRMGRLYTRYLTNWKDQVGDLMVLFADYGGASKYGAWGNQEYPGQPLSEAPKANAIELFRRSYVR